MCLTTSKQGKIPYGWLLLNIGGWKARRRSPAKRGPVKGVSYDKWRWGAEEEEHVEQIEKKPCQQQKYRQRTNKEANVSKDRLINDTI